MTETRPHHWHIAHGLAGYGPDGADGYNTATEISGSGGLADQISDELDRDAESAHGLIRTEGEAGNFKEAFEAWELHDKLTTLSLNFSIRREDAPLYKDDKPLWERTVLRLVAENFPLDVSDNSRMYVWECTEPECEHLTDDE
ncbi:hypothetical protein FDA94_28705 [Herbidospora galbida]|uniref:Uncharacterized protein n=1 Tax=Herbidospora galbida TaxID=2575442 RepID=A0A4U3M8H6_9ACTN|nr:hypothetical protein [Herbidospora galbida]TKK84612.1 hypothetical protein FDA94_28705 [Herbidospora galbida]